ncbi:hypothetical protein, partial [Flavobacterium psychrophilum]
QNEPTIHLVETKKISKNPFAFLRKFKTSPQLFYVSRFFLVVLVGFVLAFSCFAGLLNVLSLYFYSLYIV